MVRGHMRGMRDHTCAIMFFRPLMAVTGTNLLVSNYKEPPDHAQQVNCNTVIKNDIHPRMSLKSDMHKSATSC